MMCFFFSSRRRHTRWPRDWSSDVCSSDLGSAGPNSFDCSGLTMRAWQNGGKVSLMRTSRDQYRTVKKIAYSDLRPGDLVFWGTNGNDPSSEIVRAHV